MALEHGDETGGTWAEYQRLVLAELKRLNENMKERDQKMQDFQTQLAVLQVKAGVWGVLGGAITTLIGIGVFFLTRGTH